jgi:pyrroloquinoline quinone (PQQ) biosynthesis protein C
MLPILGNALGVSADEMIECELIPEARGLVDFFVRSWIDIPLAECFAVHMEEEIFGFISRDFQQSLPKYGVTNDDMKYFRIHEEADLDEEHGGTNQAILEVALQEGYGNERAGWPLEYCGKIAVQMIGNFYDGVYRRFP